MGLEAIVSNWTGLWNCSHAQSRIYGHCGPLTGDLNQAELPIELQSEPLAWFSRSAELLTGISSLALLQAWLCNGLLGRPGSRARLLGQLGLDAILKSGWGFEFASLPRWVCRTVSMTSTPIWLET